MATAESNTHLPETTKPQPIDVHSPVDTTAKASLQDEANKAQPGDAEKTSPPPPPIRVYTRTQLLALHNSPLVKPPVAMPDLKDWFGTENEQSAGRKDTEQSVPNNARERRFKNTDDGDAPSRTTFRASLTQPSQMGNFKHQSLRGDRDRERDRDGDKDRERDMRDKEGQERLRSLSDKYDRERLALPSSNTRNKDRDAAPHLLTSTSGKLNPQPQASAVASRRTEAREAAKKKAGETSEDWRRGAEPRSAREDRSENGRRDRDEREHPRSHPRETSRSRGESSAPGRDRDDKDKERDRRGERDRDLYRRERDDHRRDRDRDTDRDMELDDPRRWRDDGKREERLAARRADRHPDREHRDRDRARERVPETAWDVTNDREGRGKRGPARDRKAGTGGEDVREKDDRRDRDREPAWMDTYIPNSNTGILGSKGADGELDGIQAWKKGMKEKEERDKGPPGFSKEEKSHNVEQALDEIQFFKILMKREEEKKQNDTVDTTNTRSLEPITEPSSAATKQLSFNGLPQPSALPVERSAHSSPLNPISNPSPQIGGHKSSDASPTIIIPGEPPHGSLHHSSFHDPPKDYSQIPTISNQTSQVSPQGPPPEKGPHDSTAQFNPPPGSRLLALARTSSAKPPAPSVNQIPNGAYSNAGLPQADSFNNQGPRKGDNSHALHPFSPFEEQGRLSQLPEQNNHSGPSESHRRASAERPSFTSEMPSSRLDSPSPFDGNGGYTAPKGSRFAKFFDGKNRDAAPSMIKNQNGLASTSPAPGSRPDQGAFNGSYGLPTDHRALDDIFAMLNTSAQNQRLNTAAPAPGIYNQQNHLHPLQQQQLQQHQQHQNSRLEPLYESRLDDRNFMPDGMVPGLRSAPLPPRRDNLGMFPDSLDDSMHFNVQRLPQQTRGLEQLYSGPSPPIYSQQGRNPGLVQPQYRGGPSPIQHTSLQSLQQQRLPPGLANLGGRPPHEPSQFINIPSLPSGNLHGPHQQQQFSGFPGGGGLGFAGGPQMRTQLPGGHQLQNPSHHSMSGLGPMNNVDLRTQNQSQLLGLGPIRGIGAGYNAQQGIANQQPPMLGLRQQQQQQQLHPHMAPHLLPPHLQQQQQQQQSLSGSNNQPAHDLMALLMGGPHRE